MLLAAGLLLAVTECASDKDPMSKQRAEADKAQDEQCRSWVQNRELPTIFTAARSFIRRTRNKGRQQQS